MTDERDVTEFATMQLSVAAGTEAPDGSDVRALLALKGGSLAHVQLEAGRTSRAVRHRTVEEIWFFVGGTGEMWRKRNADEQTVRVHAGVCVTIPVGTHFQFRSFGPEPLAAVAVTMPPWPGEGEAVRVEGGWRIED